MSEPNRRPRLLDLFSGAGGAAVGYHRAGFEVVGVDHVPQKHYPFEFHQADAFEYCRERGQEFDVIHASPPCQAYSKMACLRPDKQHPDLVSATRTSLMATGRHYVIENVPGAPLRNAIILCGSMFGLRSSRGYLQRHRLFECTIAIMVPECRHVGHAIGVYGGGGSSRLRSRTAINVAEARELMGIDWMPRDSLSQAIPPAYTEFLSKQLLEALELTRARAGAAGVH